MDRCRVCQAELEEGAERCAQCGQLQAEDNPTRQPPQSVKPEPTLARCPACGTDQPAWSLFCRECGQPLRAQEEADPVLSSEIILTPAIGDGPAAEELASLAVSAGSSGLPGVFSEFPDSSWTRPPSFVGGFPAWQGAPAVPRPSIKRRSLRPAWVKRLTPRVIMIGVAALVVLISLGAGAYIFTRPRPVIQVTIDQLNGSTLAGSPDTDLHVTGHDFSPDSVVVFLLDGKSAPGAPKVTSDHAGHITALLTITDDWSFSTHTLTARDAQGYATHDGVSVRVLPQLVLSISSKYTQGSAPAGSVGTTFYVDGKRFTPHAAVTLLLDDKPLTLDSPLTSDARGQINTVLSVPASWALGGHALTARDAMGYVTQWGAGLVIVKPGEADTPGPNGAPADDATFSVYFNVQAINLSTGKGVSFRVFANVTGQPDPAGGTVCNLQYDTNQPFTTNGAFSNGEKFTETLTTTCAGSYKSGNISYTETVTSDRFVLENGLVCSTQRAYVLNALVGTYTKNGFSGAYHSASAVVPCSNGSRLIYNAYAGTWTAVM